MSEGLILINYGIEKHCNQSRCHCAPKLFHIDMSGCSNHDCLNRGDNKSQQLLSVKYVNKLFIPFQTRRKSQIPCFSSQRRFILQLVNMCANNLNMSYRCSMRASRTSLLLLQKKPIWIKASSIGWSRMCLFKFWFRTLCIGVMFNLVIGRSHEFTSWMPGFMTFISLLSSSSWWSLRGRRRMGLLSFFSFKPCVNVLT